MARRALLVACVVAAVAPVAPFAPCAVRGPPGSVRPSAFYLTCPPLFGGRPVGSPRLALERSGDPVEEAAPGQRGLLKRWQRAWSTRGVTADGKAVPSGETLSEVIGALHKMRAHAAARLRRCPRASQVPYGVTRCVPTVPG